MSTSSYEVLDRNKFREDLRKYQKLLREQNKHPVENAEKIVRIQRWIEKSSYRILLSDPSYYLELGLDAIVWKECFYHPIEAERSKLKERTKSKMDINPDTLLNLVNRALDYYVVIYRKVKDIPAIDQVHPGSLNSIAQPSAPSSPSSPSAMITPCFSQKTKILITCNLFVHIGDLYRYEVPYITPAGETPNYEKAESAYKQVIALDPGCGIGHHQLAVLAVNGNADILALYRYIRSIASFSPFPLALKNLRVLCAKNEKTMNGIRLDITSKKEGVTAFTKLFIELIRMMCDGIVDNQRFSTLMFNCIQIFDRLLMHDTLSTQFVFRVVMIAIFAASDLWTHGEDRNTSQSGVLSESVLNGWLCLMNIMTRIFIHTNSETCSSLRHMPSIRLFLFWLELQKADGYRPKYMASETSVNSSSSYSVFGDVEHRLWRTLVAFMNRLPLRETTVTDNAPLRYEVEVRGFLPFKGCFDNIAGSSAFCNEEDSLTRYMISICVSFNHLKDDPRCPVRIDKDDHLQYYIINPMQSRDPYRSALFDSLPPLTSTFSINGDDETTSIRNSTFLGFHSRNVSNLTRLSGSPNDPLGSRSSSRSISGTLFLSRGGTNGVTLRSHSGESTRTMSPFQLSGNEECQK